MDYVVKNRIWICTSEGTFIGQGRVALLKEIDNEGSISKAAKAMKMSYRKAWELVHSMNRQCETPLVKSTKGGSGGGGARLTTAGREAIALFDCLNEKCEELLRAESRRINFQ